MAPGNTTTVPATAVCMPVPTAAKAPMSTVIIPLPQNTASTAPPSIKLAVTVLPVLPMWVPLPMKVTIFPMVPGRAITAVSTAGLCTVRTADTAIMNIPVTVCPTVHGLPPVLPSTDGR